MSKRRSCSYSQNKVYCYCPVKITGHSFEPFNITIEDINPTTVEVYFSLVQQPITNILYSLNNGLFVALDPAQTVSPILLTGLIASTQYILQLKTINTVGESIPSDAILFTTQSPPIQSGSLRFLESYMIYFSLPNPSTTFTIEFWFQYVGISNTQYPIILGRENFFEILVNDDGLPFNQITVHLPGQTRNTGTAIVTDQNWHHIVFVQTNGVFVLYVDGIQDFYFSGSSFSFDYFSIGCAYWAPSVSYINGRLSNIRIVNGTAIYTETFTPPTAPLTAISGTILLLNTPFNENYLVDSSPFQLVGSVNGNVASSSENPYN
jgi:hypothetical protein